MATVRISQLTAITAPTDDDVLIINDADTNTRKITFANLTQNLVNTTAATQTKSGAFTVNGTLTAGGNFVVDTNTFFVDATSNRVGVRTISPNTELDIDGTVHIRNSNTLQFGDANDSNYVSLGAPSVIAANFALTLPAALPSANNLVWSSNSGQLGYTAGIAYDSGTQAMSLGQAYFTNQGSVRFYEQSVNGSDYVGFTAPANLSSTTGYTLPSTYPAASGHVLASTTGGVLSWVSNGAGAAGNAGDVQFSDGATLTANSNFNFNNGSQTLSVPNVSVGALLEANGNVYLGNSSGDDIQVNGSIATDVLPKTTGTLDLGSNLLHYAQAHVDDLYVYGSVELGNALSDTVGINGVVDSNIVPDASLSRNLGSLTNYWNTLYLQTLELAGNATLGNNAGDLITFNGEITGNLIPNTTNTISLGSATRILANVHTNQLSTYGTTTLGDTNADSVVINGVLQSNLVPSGSFTLGTTGSRWSQVNAASGDFSGTVAANAINVTSQIDLGTSLIRPVAPSSHGPGPLTNEVVFEFNAATGQGAIVECLLVDSANNDVYMATFTILHDGASAYISSGSGVIADGWGGTNPTFNANYSAGTGPGGADMLQLRCSTADAISYSFAGSVRIFDGLVGPAITIVTQPVNVSIVEGDVPAVFNTTAITNDSGTISYQWQVDDGVNPITNLTNVAPYSNVTTSVLTVTTTSTAENGYQYRCRVSSSGTASPAFTNLVNLNVAAAAITVTTSPVNATVATGSPHTFTAAGTTNETLASVTYQWEVDTGSGFAPVLNGGTGGGGNYSGATTSSLAIDDVTGLNGDIYRCVITSTSAIAPTANTASATLTVV